MSASTKIRLKGVKINTLIPAASLVGLVPDHDKYQYATLVPKKRQVLSRSVRR